MGGAGKRIRLLLSLLLAGLAAPLWAQTEDPMIEAGLPRTKLEALGAQEGAVIIRGSRGSARCGDRSGRPSS